MGSRFSLKEIVSEGLDLGLRATHAIGNVEGWSTYAREQRRELLGRLLGGGERAQADRRGGGADGELAFSSDVRCPA